MRKVERLKKDARETCRLLGHSMSKFVAHMRHDYRETWEAECVDCGDYVQVKVHPLPNETQMGGSAFARQCPTPKLWPRR